MKEYQNIIIGAGMYGLYAAAALSKKGRKVLVIDCDEAPFLRGSFVNQARLHNGYHYPRSYSTAAKSAKYYERYYSDFKDCINGQFTQIYAVAKNYSWANAQQFRTFCKNLNLRCDLIDTDKYFNSISVEEAWITEEATFDAALVNQKLFEETKNNNVEFIFNSFLDEIEQKGKVYNLKLSTGETVSAPFVLNATYAGTNQIHELMHLEPLNIKYELCEIVCCNVTDNIKDIGLTLMDGPFFSLMPFGKTGMHSLTTVSRTPHITSYNTLPTFDCQKNCDCTPQRIKNCTTCPHRPESAFTEMNQTAKKYLSSDISAEYLRSYYTLKPILKVSEIDDSRPTLVQQYSEDPYFYSVFSGKINTMYDLDDILKVGAEI